MKKVNLLISPLVRLLRVFPVDFLMWFYGGRLPVSLNRLSHFLLKINNYIKYYLFIPYAKSVIGGYSSNSLYKVGFGPYKWKMFFNPKRGEVDMHIAVGGRYEEEISYFFTKFCKGKDLLLDIGANIGYYTMLGNQVDGGMFIHSFEPVVETFKTLEKNVNSLNSENVKAYQLALGSEDKIIQIERKADSGHNSLLPTKNLSTGEKEEITVSVLDELLTAKEKKIMIKIDVEGYEFEALKGAKNLLENNKVTIILEYTPSFFRHFSTNHEIYGKEFLSFLTQRGFNLYELDQIWIKPIHDTDDFIKNLGTNQTYLIASNFEEIR